MKAIGVTAALLTSTSSMQLFTGQLNAGSAVVTGAAFNSSVAPAPAARTNGTNVELSWPQVTMDSGAPTSYFVERLSTSGSTVNVCTGANTPVAVAGTMSCTDSGLAARSTYNYRETVKLIRGGLATWSLGPSVVSQSFAVPTITFAGAGASATTPKSGTATVNYPTSTTIGDLLVLVIASSKNAEPPTPTGWTKLAAVGFSGTTSLHLLVAWRIADGIGTNTLITSPNNGAYSTGLIYRYQPWPGNTVTPNVAEVAVNSGHQASGAIPGTITTTSGYATAFSIVALPGSHDLQLGPTNGFTFRQSQVILAGSEVGTIGLADATVELSGSSAFSPTWSANPVGTNWLYMTFAFA